MWAWSKIALASCVIISFLTLPIGIKSWIRPWVPMHILLIGYHTDANPHMLMVTSMVMHVCTAMLWVQSWWDRYSNQVDIWTIIIILRLLLSVRVSGRWPEAIWPELKHFLSGHRWTSDVTTGSPLTRLIMAQTATKLRLFQKDGGIELDWNVYLHEVAWWTQKSNVLESMLSTGTLRKEAILF
jgi:hypothetical protein